MSLSNAQTKPAVITIDAKGRSLGRVASEAAVALRGKLSPAFERHVAPKQKVVVINASQMKLSLHKQKTTDKVRYSGYPGGLRTLTWEQIIAKKGYAEPLRVAIEGMLSRTRLRPAMMTNLTITE